VHDADGTLTVVLINGARAATAKLNVPASRRPRELRRPYVEQGQLFRELDRRVSSGRERAGAELRRRHARWPGPSTGGTGGAGAPERRAARATNGGTAGRRERAGGASTGGSGGASTGGASAAPAATTRRVRLPFRGTRPGSSFAWLASCWRSRSAVAVRASGSVLDDHVICARTGHRRGWSSRDGHVRRRAPARVELRHAWKPDARPEADMASLGTTPARLGRRTRRRLAPYCADRHGDRQLVRVTVTCEPSGFHFST